MGLPSAVPSVESVRVGKRRSAACATLGKEQGMPLFADLAKNAQGGIQDILATKWSVDIVVVYLLLVFEHEALLPIKASRMYALRGSSRMRRCMNEWLCSVYIEYTNRWQDHPFQRTILPRCTFAPSLSLSTHAPFSFLSRSLDAPFPVLENYSTFHATVAKADCFHSEFDDIIYVLGRRTPTRSKRTWTPVILPLAQGIFVGSLYAQLAS